MYYMLGRSFGRHEHVGVLHVQLNSHGGMMVSCLWLCCELASVSVK